MNKARDKRTLAALIGVVAVMTGMAWAAVPLYDLFCRVTGFSGTTQVAASGSDTVLDRMITVRFDASTARGMPWEFKPVQKTMTVRIGETNLAFYEAHNPTDHPVAGSASFNVTPLSVGGYFVKIDCFCFVEQVLAPGESVMMPVSFYVDPALVDDVETARTHTITLSYTFFETEISANAGIAPEIDNAANGG